MTGNRKDRLPGNEEKKALIEDFKTKNAKRFKGTIAPFKALEALEKGLSDDMEADIRRDVELFSECAISDVAKNLIGVFLNTRAAGRLPRINGVEPARIKKVAMLGGGVMGSGIVHLLINNGFDAILWDINEQAVQKALKSVRKTFAFAIKQNKMTDQDLEKLMGERLTTTTSPEDLKEVDLVIEAVLEDMKVKQDLWKRLEPLCKPQTIFATNTSALPITEMASALSDPSRMIGLHFFNPAHRMQLLEIICAEKTSNQTLATSVGFARSIRKTPVVVNDGPGFYVTRQLIALLVGFVYLVADGMNRGPNRKGDERFRNAHGARRTGRSEWNRHWLSRLQNFRAETRRQVQGSPPLGTDLSDRLLREKDRERLYGLFRRASCPEQKGCGCCAKVPERQRRLAEAGFRQGDSRYVACPGDQ